MERKRLQELGVQIGSFSRGRTNSIIDIEGVKVGHRTLHWGEGVRTGVTAVLPHGGNLFREKVLAAVHVINGFGKTAGTIQIEELGVLESPVMLSNTLSVGDVMRGTTEHLMEGCPEIGDTAGTVNVFVGECNDGYLNDIRGLHVTPDDAKAAIMDAHNHGVEEGCVGAGTGMLCLGYKGGIGTSSRKHRFSEDVFTVGTLVVTNFGRREDLPFEVENKEEKEDVPDGSIMIILATDAPMSERQLKRLAKRAAFGLSRTGSYAAHGSGDIVLAFSTAHRIPHEPPEGNTYSYTFIKEDGEIISTLFKMAVDCVEEAVWNSLAMAETTTGRKGRKVEAIQLERLKSLKGDM
ncbi:P1 family peptidase [Rossellomorea aquimaris]|uniref:P1 family peptidase n=1 Tax=Rossellomorea aquimaris TaxID=189382 RepID=UPI001CD4B719|nr:P1 family peptidase [Rossellomorea aquimaris]MCA1057040.1 P1 family peptidase [Rossellomorea aquimaris]